MIGPSLLLFLATTALAASSSDDDDNTNPYSKFVSDANSLLAAATGTAGAQLSALYDWQATQTAVPSDAIDAQYQSYLDAYMTTTSAPLPAWVTAIPSSLQPIATSFLHAEASLVVQDIAPMISELDVRVSAYTAAQATLTATAPSADMTEVSTRAPAATASSGFTTGIANATSSQVSGNGTVSTGSANGTASITSVATASGSPTNSVTPPQTTFPASGADKPASVAIVAALVGVLGMMVLL